MLDIIYSNIEDFRQLKAIKSIRKVSIVSAKVVRQNPFASLLLWVHSVFENEVARITSLPPHCCLMFFSGGFVKWLAILILAEGS